MWTYNSARALQKSLPSIQGSIHEEDICHRIAVDAGSIDETQSILNRYGWTVQKAPRKGIPYQANQALATVDAEFFAAFEHDIVLNRNWFERTSNTIGTDRRIGAVQGIRLFTGSKTMRAIEAWLYRTNRIPVWSYSMDNTLFRTEAVRRAGGFSNEDPASADTLLRRSLFTFGYRWITDNTLISGHYRKDFLEQFKHQIRSFELARYYWSSAPTTGSVPRRIVSMIGGNPTHVLKMTLQGRMLRIPVAWYILRLQRGIYLNIPHKDKAVRPVAMDDWHLNQFQGVLKASSESLQEYGRCAVCGERTRFVYTIPTDWGNILPKLNRGIARRFYACSNEHAEQIGAEIFMHAFDYVAPGRGP